MPISEFRSVKVLIIYFGYVHQLRLKVMEGHLLDHIFELTDYITHIAAINTLHNAKFFRDHAMINTHVFSVTSLEILFYDAIFSDNYHQTNHQH